MCFGPGSVHRVVSPMHVFVSVLSGRGAAGMSERRHHDPGAVGCARRDSLGQVHALRCGGAPCILQCGHITCLLPAVSSDRVLRGQSRVEQMRVRRRVQKLSQMPPTRFLVSAVLHSLAVSSSCRSSGIWTAASMQTARCGLPTATHIVPISITFRGCFATWQPCGNRNCRWSACCMSTDRELQRRRVDVVFAPPFLQKSSRGGFGDKYQTCICSMD